MGQNTTGNTVRNPSAVKLTHYSGQSHRNKEDGVSVIGLSTPELMYLELLKKSLNGSIYDESAWDLLKTTDEYNPITPRKIWDKTHIFLRNSIIKAFRSRSIVLIRTSKIDQEARKSGLDWPFIGYTMIGEQRLQNIEDCVRSILERGIEGDFIETGAWRGGATIFMRALLKLFGIKDRRVWVADSFEGMPKPKDSSDGADLSHMSYLNVSLEQVKSNFAKFGLLDEQVIFLKGWFCDTLPKAPVEKIALLRLDGDLYTSTMDSLQICTPKLVQAVSSSLMIIIHGPIAAVRLMISSEVSRVKRTLST